MPILAVSAEIRRVEEIAEIYRLMMRLVSFGAASRSLQIAFWRSCSQ
ncbi:hypothetical protein [Parapedobacter tibetensis]|nr:hypothetical protein [Parapedobacter tibetensis]